jgi:hypothetical protein
LILVIATPSFPLIVTPVENIPLGMMLNFSPSPMMISAFEENQPM